MLFTTATWSLHFYFHIYDFVLNSCIAEWRLWEYWGQSCQLTSWFQRLITWLIKDQTQLRWWGKGCNSPRKGWVNHAVMSLVWMGRWVVRKDTAFSSSWEGAVRKPQPFELVSRVWILSLPYIPQQFGGSLYSSVLMNSLVMFPKASLLPLIKWDTTGGRPGVKEILCSYIISTSRSGRCCWINRR